MPINQHICLCQELRDLLKGKHGLLLEMTLCFIAYCAAIKHLLGRQLSHLFFSCASLPHRSDCLKVLFTNLCLPREEHESETVLCRNLQIPRMADSLQLSIPLGLPAFRFGWQRVPLLGHRSSRQYFAAASLLDIFD